MTNYDKKVTKESIADWYSWWSEEDDPSYPLDNYFNHTYAKWECYDIAGEGVSVWNLMFRDVIEHDSPMGDVFTAVAIQSYRGALAAVAAAIGVDADALESAVSDWYEHQDNLPQPVGYAGLEEKVKEAVKWHEDFMARKLD